MKSHSGVAVLVGSYRGVRSLRENTIVAFFIAVLPLLHVRHTDASTVGPAFYQDQVSVLQPIHNHGLSDRTREEVLRASGVGCLLQDFVPAEGADCAELLKNSTPASPHGASFVQTGVDRSFQQTLCLLTGGVAQLQERGKLPPV